MQGEDSELYKVFMDPGVRQESKINSGEINGKADKLANRVHNQLHKHLQNISNEVDVLVANKQIEGVFIGGHKQLFGLLTEALSSSIQQKLRGEFVSELDITEEEIIDHCRKTFKEYLAIQAKDV